MNIRDTEIIAQTLAESGYTKSPSIEKADLVVLNTCSIRAKAEQKVFSLLGSLRKAKKLNPALKICVAGCVAQQEGQKIIKRMPHVDLVIGTQHIYNLPTLLKQSKHNTIAINLSDNYEIPRFVPRLSTADAQAGSPTPAADMQFSRFVTIMQGCNNFCTYCVVPYTRGREVSRGVKDIIEEIKKYVDSGVCEITLLGQNVNSYGQSNSVLTNGLPCSFSMLLHQVAKVDGLKRLRFTTSHPKDLSDELISCFAEIGNLCPQFHLPVQSGSDAVLRRMNRKYTITDYRQKVEKLLNARPDLALTTDIIVGFPGETDKDFQKTLDLLENIRYHGSFSFKYSDRPGIKASHLDGKIEEHVKSERLQIFQKRQDEISLERNEEYIGKSLLILVESADYNKLAGRTATNHIVHAELLPSQMIRPGEFVKALITSAGHHSLRADLLP